MESQQREVLQRLRAFSLARDRLEAVVARRTGVSATEFTALEVLEVAGRPLTPRELGFEVGLTSGAVTALIDRLERQGWLRRLPHPTDRRSVLLELTPDAVAAGEREVGPWAEAMAEAASQLNPTAARAISRFLDQVAELARTHGDELLEQRL